MRFLRRSSFVALAATLATALNLHAQSEGTGVLTGRVTDVSGRPLGGVLIRVGTATLGVATERDGTYRVVRVPAGAQQISYRYIGFTPVNATVQIVAGKSVANNVQLKEAATKLSAVVVEGQVAGQAAALNQQRTASNISSVVDNELVGRLPDPNMAEALARVPGIAMIRDQGEGRFVQIRGTRADLNSLSINGERVATPEQSSRQIPMDIIPSDQAAAIQVSKTLSADMDADAIGGNVNIVTRMPRAGQPMFNATMAGGYNALGGGALRNLNLNAGKRFGAKQKFGAIVGMTNYRNDRASQNFEGTWCVQDGDCGVAGNSSLASLDAPRLWETRDYPQVDRLRQGVNAGFDYLLGEGSKIFLRGTWNGFVDDEIRLRTRYGFRGGSGSRWTQVSADSGITTGSRMDRDIRLRLVRQRIISAQLGGEHVSNRGDILTWSLATSQAQEDRPNVRTMVFRQSNMSFGYNFEDEERPRVNVAAGSFDDPTRFAFNSFTREVRLTADRDVSARVNYQYPVAVAGFRGFVKGGVVARIKDRENRTQQTISTSALAANTLGATGATLFNGLVTQTSGNRLFGGDYSMGRHADAERVSYFLKSNGASFTTDVFNSTLATAGNSFKVGEDVMGGYLMATLDRGRLRLVPGLRVEATQVDNRANRIQVQGTTATVTPVTGTSSYSNLFPSLNATWAFDEMTNIRAAVTTSMVRPQFVDMVPYTRIDIGQPTARIGNPALKATTALNYDLMVERYFRGVGFVSVGGFYKDLTNFIYATSRARTADEQLGPDATLVVQPVNGPKGKIYGFELAWQQTLSFLPGIWSGLGINANYTYTQSETTLPLRGAEKFALPGQTGNAGNIGAFFDRGRVSMRVGANYAGDFISFISPVTALADQRTRSRMQIDASGSVRLNGNAKFFVEAINLNNVPLRAVVGGKNNRGGGGEDPSFEFYRPWAMAGFRIER
ncbi:MAG: TonB-dependent receptor [Gemmatimonadaceae bacterium]|nr:TonB-dependent receptor [Gemmatimonadaceae bacterium]